MTVEPAEGRICPSQNITCRVQLVSSMRWTGNLFGEPVNIIVFDSKRTLMVSRDNGIKLWSSIERESESDFIGNVTSHLYSDDLFSLNGSNLTCMAIAGGTSVPHFFTSYVFGKMGI